MILCLCILSDVGFVQSWHFTAYEGAAVSIDAVASPWSMNNSSVPAGFCAGLRPESSKSSLGDPSSSSVGAGLL